MSERGACFFTTLAGWLVITTCASVSEASLLLHGDGSWESAYWWPEAYGSAPPDHGAFAEHYSGSGAVESIAIFAGGTGLFDPVFVDVFVWADDSEGHPGAVLCARVNVNVPEPPVWPGVQRLDVSMDGCCVEGSWWVGFWNRSVVDGGAIFVWADLNGPNLGTPMTKVPPGLQWPEGWQDVDVVWGEGVHSLGIGAVLEPCEPVAVETGSWGRVKALYQSPGR